jgi:hypothetical protein
MLKKCSCRMQKAAKAAGMRLTDAGELVQPEERCA